MRSKKDKPKRKRRTKRRRFISRVERQDRALVTKPAKRKKRQTSTALVPVAPAPIAKRGGLNREQVDLLKRTVAKGTSDDEFKLFLWVAQKHKLDPMTRQLHCVMRYDKHIGKDKMVIQIGIDGYRAMAARSHKDYGSISEPEFEYKDKEHKHLLLARVKCWKKGIEHPTVGVAYWDEYAPDPNSKQAFFWNHMPHGQLGKCAEAIGLRKAWPDLSDIYTDEEMAQADIDLSPEGREVTDLEGRPLSAPPLPAVAALEPRTSPPLPTDPEEGKLAKIEDYREITYRKGIYVKVQWGPHECTCWDKDLWPHLKAGVGELAVLTLRRSGNYLNIVGISSIGNKTFSEVEGKSVPDIQVSVPDLAAPDKHAARDTLNVRKPDRQHLVAEKAVSRPATRNSKKILITFKGDYAEVSGDTTTLREKIMDGMAGKRDEQRKLYVIPSAWVPTLEAVCEDQSIEVEERG